MEKLAYPGWRSALFIPAHIEKFVSKAHTRGADAYILDLEDSVPLDQKSDARLAVKNAAVQVCQGGADALVRVNIESELLFDDLDAVVCSEVKAVVLPKVDGSGIVQAVAERLDMIEDELGLENGHTGLVVMIENVAALPVLDDIASAHPRVVGIMLGSEDFSATAGMEPTPQTLLYPNQMLVFAARRAGIAPLGFPASIADYSDIEKFEQTVQFSKQLGFMGAFCIHPKQVEVLNSVHTPTSEQIEEAKAIVETFEQALAEGKGAVQYKSKMLDLPVVERARELLLNKYAQG